MSVLLPALVAAACSSAPGARLAWDVPADCPDAATADAALGRLLAGSTATPGAERTARVRIELEAPRFRAQVWLDDELATVRVLEADTCAEVADAAVLIVAMAIDPRIGGAPEPTPTLVPEPTPEPSPETRPTPEPIAAAPITAPRVSAAPRPAAPRRSRPPLHALLRAAAGVGVGGPPAPSGLVALGVALAGPRWRAELDADLWTPRRRDAAADPRVGVEVLGWSVGVRGCGSPVVGRFELPLCAGLRAGALRGRGVGALVSSAASAPWLNASAGVGLWGWIRPRFALALDVEGTVALTRPRFRVEPAGMVFRAAPAGLRACFGPVVRLP